MAERLKNSDQPIADAFPDVSVMFADIVNFTPMAAAISICTSGVLIELVTTIFSAWRRFSREALSKRARS